MSKRERVKSMRADQISEIVVGFNDSPYRTILIDGEWGIGKTYEIEKSIAGKKNYYKVSLFGLNECRDVYKELLWGNHHDSIKKFTEVSSSILKWIPKKYGISIDFKEIASKYIYDYYGRKNNGQSNVFIFDDIERASSSFHLEEFMGIIERLRQETQVKIILVANSKALENGDKIIFEKYKEKVVEKTYKVEELSDLIIWSRFSNNELLIREFIEKHGVSNLRTIEKARQFYLDVRQSINVDDKRFLDLIEIICFAVVVEDVDQIYLNKLHQITEQNKTDLYQKEHEKHLINNFSYRIANSYLNELYVDSTLINSICNYYYNSANIDNEMIKHCYSVYIKAGEKNNFYKSDEELKETVESLVESFGSCKSLAEAFKLANTIAHCMQILEADLSEFIQESREVFDELVDKELEANGVIDIDLFYLDISPNIETLFSDIKESTPNKEFSYIIQGIKKSIQGHDYEHACSLFKNLQSRYPRYKEKLADGLKTLVNSDILPKGSIEESQWRYLHLFYEFGSEYIEDELLNFTNAEIEKTDSPVLKYRLQSLKNKYLSNGRQDMEE